MEFSDLEELMSKNNVVLQLLGNDARKLLPDPMTPDTSPFDRYRDDFSEPAIQRVERSPDFNPYEVKSSMEMGKGKASQSKLMKDRLDVPFSDRKSCSLCDCSSDELKLCGRCYSAWYCSPECQKKDWLYHKNDCNFLVKMNESHESGPSVQRCTKCKSYFEKLKKCSKCKSVKYCSKECQVADWKKHRSECGRQEGEQRATTPPVTQREIEYVRNKLPEMIKATLGDDSTVEKIAFNYPDALRIAKRLFPGKRVETSLGVLPFPKPWNDTEPLVMLVQIVKFHPKVEQHGVFITDENDDSSFILFMEELMDPRPHFQWSDLIAGNYVCISNPIFSKTEANYLGFIIDSKTVDTVKIIRSQPFTKPSGTIQLKAVDIIYHE